MRRNYFNILELREIIFERNKKKDVKSSNIAYKNKPWLHKLTVTSTIYFNFTMFI